MKYLLDTHCFLWWVGNDDRLSDIVREVISDADNEIYFSAVSAWEMAIKAQSGKLSLDSELSVFLKRHLRSNAFGVMPISLPHAVRAGNLPLLHRDPFDRMLVAQAQIEEVLLISRDPEIAKYTVDIYW